MRRLLGMAFAAADLLVEIDAAGRITLAIGAGKAMVAADAPDLTGRYGDSLFHSDDQALVSALLKGLDDGERRGPVVIRLAGEPLRAAKARSFRLPNGTGVSLALTAVAVPRHLIGDGLQTGAAFESTARGLIEAARVSGQDLELALVEIGGLAAARKTMSPEQATALNARVAAEVRLQSQDGTSAARVGDERFALLRAEGRSETELADHLTRALSRDIGSALSVEAKTLTVERNLDASQALRAMRFALDDFAQEGFKDGPPQTLAEAMSDSVRRTLTRAGALGVAVSERKFQLAFQPVVSLKTGKAHHHEVLVRFEGGESPYDMIRMAEEFDLIAELDHAVVDQAVRRLKASQVPGLKLAVNVSGRTITSDAFVKHVSDLLTRSESVRGNLIFEVTESAAIDDLPQANRQIQALRKMGSLVCLDDFGAGAASFAYLQQLTVDIVKIDGQYVREMSKGGREAAMVRHVVQLCGELKVRTVAEMVETADIENAVRKLGVDFAQGWRYGLPSEKPEPPMATGLAPAARRA